MFLWAYIVAGEGGLCTDQVRPNLHMLRVQWLAGVFCNVAKNCDISVILLGEVH